MQESPEWSGSRNAGFVGLREGSIDMPFQIWRPSQVRQAWLILSLTGANIFPWNAQLGPLCSALYN